MSGIRMIWIMTVEGLLKTDWLGILGVIAPPIISAWVAYQIARYQIDTQLKKQNELEVKKEKRMLVTKLRLDKHEHFLSTLTEYSNLVDCYLLNIRIHIDGVRTVKETNEVKSTLDSKINQKGAELALLGIYYPFIKADLDKLFRFHSILYGELNKDFVTHDLEVFNSKNTKHMLFDVNSPQYELITTTHESFKEKVGSIRTSLTSVVTKILTDLESEL